MKAHFYTTLIVLALILCPAKQTCAQDLFEVRRLTTDPAQEGFPTWSPHGDSLIYQHTDMQDTSGKNGFWKVSQDGSGAKQIFAGVGEHAKWSPDGRLVVFDADTGQSIKMIPAGGGDPITFLPDTIQIRNGGLPHWSPDGSKIAFIEGSSVSLCVYHMESGKLSSIFRKEGTVPLPGGWTTDGKQVLVALMEMPERKSTIWKISLDEKENRQITGHHENFYRHLALSPDGSLLVYAALEGRHLGLYIMPTEGGASLPFAVSPDAHNEGPIWSPDGKKIAFNSTRGQNADIWVMDLDIEEVWKKLKAAASSQ
ncbi:MAG: PD40 domain-containing protein [Bacteroidetes bacterium]|nr:PD40 domain-containing protein [Bacteroidota bacterium]